MGSSMLSLKSQINSSFHRKNPPFEEDDVINACVVHDLGRPRIAVAGKEEQFQLLAGWGRLKQAIVALLGDLRVNDRKMGSEFDFSHFQSGSGSMLQQMEVRVRLRKFGGEATPANACVVRVRNTADGQWEYRLNKQPATKVESVAATVASRLQVL